jgi:hypothetical protein
LSNIKNIPFILDISSPPLLSGFSASTFFFASGHPLALYISAFWQPLVQLDTSGGNVTYTCLSLAESLGAQNITLFGADFSYVNSQTYARGTYIYPFFTNRQNRLSPLESQLSTFLYRSPFLLSENGEKKEYYETSTLRFYRKKFEEKASRMSAKIICEKGRGAPININPKISHGGTEAVHSFGMQRLRDFDKKISGTEFLVQYRDDIIALPTAREKENYLQKLNTKEQQIFTTLLPLAAAIKKSNPELKQANLIEEVKHYSINEIDRVIR